MLAIQRAQGTAAKLEPMAIGLSPALRPRSRRRSLALSGKCARPRFQARVIAWSPTRSHVTASPSPRSDRAQTPEPKGLSQKLDWFLIRGAHARAGVGRLWGFAVGRAITRPAGRSLRGRFSELTLPTGFQQSRRAHRERPPAETSGANGRRGASSLDKQAFVLGHSSRPRRPGSTASLPRPGLTSRGWRTSRTCAAGKRPWSSAS
jgi:hypothetical protein